MCIMFCNKPKNVNRNVPAKRNRKRRKKATYPQENKKPIQTVQNSSSLAIAMSHWAETYTAAATWQLKHQIAYWKSRAKALEYENKVLHDVIKKNYFKDSALPTSNTAESSESSEDIGEGSEEEQDEEVEVSEEFIEFLKKNAKYKEDARREREQYKASREENDETCMEEETVEGSEEKKARFKELYGSNWEKIMALETSILCDFIHEKDTQRPQYWPNIPFNFDY
ncbi:uncharacterized protein [Epargyreus clarus]|uniref:uncharacterized protein n=1 Tax=Epargyreus clarus TaxID=520877 RepID=UPI003C2C085E